MNKLKHVTFSIRSEHVEYLEEIKLKYALPTRSAALAFLIEDHKNLDKKINIVTGGTFIRR